MKIGSKLPLQIHIIRAKLSQITHDGPCRSVLNWLLNQKQQEQV